MKYIIGISAYYHDSSVCLFKDGKLVFACEEEKFTGIKHDSSFPTNALKYIKKEFKITKKNTESVCYYEDPKLKLSRVKKNIKKQFFKHPIYSLKSYFNIKKNIWSLKRNLKSLSNVVFYSLHHDSHLYYSYYTSRFNNSVCLSIDGVGEYDTTSIGIINNGEIESMSLSKYPHSLGLFYSAMTSFLGFKPNEGEYKMMGLAPYGCPNTYIDAVRRLITYENGELKCDMKTFTWDRSDTTMFNYKLCDTLIEYQRLPDEPIEQRHMDIASAVQKRYEEILFEMLLTVKRIDENTNLCLGGGCAYNGTANGKIIDNSHIEHLWIPPAPSDAGSSIGACINYMVNHKGYKNKITQNPFIGPQITISESDLSKTKHTKFPTNKSLIRYVAKKLKEGNIVGWFKGKSEFGARALGHRSILADPTIKGIKDKINRVIKKRESFRPFAPMVIQEKQHDYFHMVDDIPYMNQVVKVKDSYKDILSEITHVDGSARVQSVYKDPYVYPLLIEFEKISGFPILLNTSMNVKGQTMIITPQDAIKMLQETEMDFLVIDNYIIFK